MIRRIRRIKEEKGIEEDEGGSLEGHDCFKASICLYYICMYTRNEGEK